MRIVEFDCPRCDDTWAVPNPTNPRDECRKCGGSLETETYTVTL